MIERHAVELAVDMARNIIEGAVEINPEYIIPIIREAIQMAGGATIERVRVSPEDMEFIEVIGVAKRLKEHDGSWNFEADPEIKSGCVVDTSAGQVDYQLDQAWARARDEVLKLTR